MSTSILKPLIDLESSTKMIPLMEDILATAAPAL